MRLVVAAIGRLKDGPERELAERYRKRAEQSGRRIGFRDTEVVEIRESRAQDVSKRMIEESIALTNLIPDKAIIIILDERGESLDSATLASRLGRWRDDGRPAAVFIIGGDDGLAPALREKASVKLAFGAATWPHQLVRVMLLEQIYRAVSILSGHPYHRA
ncbi:MAG: 23S rRNA (pseudouridine(1915)-N(3))-methyltransferase RlmH [Xanthobacteraceae bacterium]|nr:23S rRNA (pseudouridine(1915)-N(3))-methyltransferase RlmH [Xanthobacteraceae bacterium]